MLIADREGGDHPHRGGQLAHGFAIQRVAGRAHDAVAALGRLDQRRTVINPVLGIERGVEIAGQPCLDVGRKMASRQHARFAVSHGRYLPCAALPQPMILVIRGHGYYAETAGYKALPVPFVR